MIRLSWEEFMKRYGPLRATVSLGRTVKDGDYVYGAGRIKLSKPVSQPSEEPETSESESEYFDEHQQALFNQNERNLAALMDRLAKQEAEKQSETKPRKKES